MSTALLSVLSAQSTPSRGPRLKLLTQFPWILDQIFVRGNLTCADRIEYAWYSAGYEDICLYCGTTEELSNLRDKTTNIKILS